mmetsp:Transcript_10862/g.33470  ORF Transcript_10862/g.33470 Transcript_10862/m.33470 type:complete len:91 (+) Transcript_10862:234-506(+)|eukprot:scaffold72189_cov34-Tisochrysis_lutea.AAC.1
MDTSDTRLARTARCLLVSASPHAGLLSPDRMLRCRKRSEAMLQSRAADSEALDVGTGLGLLPGDATATVNSVADTYGLHIQQASLALSAS